MEENFVEKREIEKKAESQPFFFPTNNKWDVSCAGCVDHHYVINDECIDIIR